MTYNTKKLILIILGVLTAAAALLYAAEMASRKPEAVAGQAFRNTTALCEKSTITYEVQADGQSLEFTLRCAAKEAP